MSKQIFISYRRRDTSWVTTSIYQSLLGSFSKDQIFRDINSIPFGVDFFEVIETEVSKCDVLIAVIGKDWLQLMDVTNALENSTDFVRIEIATALKRQVRVIPVLVDDARMPKPNELPADIRYLSRINAVPISHTRFNADVKQLIKVLQIDQPNARLQLGEKGILKTPTQQLKLLSKNQEIFLVLFTCAIIGCFIVGFFLSALVAAILQGPSTEAIQLDSPLGTKLFLICSLVTFVLLSVSVIVIKTQNIKRRSKIYRQVSMQSSKA